MSTPNASSVKGLHGEIRDRISLPQTQRPVTLTQRFVPWINGKNISGSDKWGFTWFQYNMNFVGINTNGKYLIENGCDAYIFLGEQPISTQSLSTYKSKIVPPFTTGIYDTERDAFTLTCLCAGYDFTTTRAAPGSNSPLANVRNPLSTIAVTSLGSENDLQSQQPPIRTGWSRVYDWYDLTTSPNSSIVIAASGIWSSPNCDFTGAKSVSANVSVSNAAGVTYTVTILTVSPASATRFFQIGGTTITAAGTSNVEVDATALTGIGPFIRVSNLDAVNSITVLDANLEVAL